MQSGEPRTNRLLSLLSDDDYERLRPHLSRVVFDYKKSLYEASRPIEQVYFPVDGVASLVITTADGSSAEVGTIGSEGIVGLPVCLGDRDAPSSVYVQVPGTALGMDAGIFRTQIERSPTLNLIMLHYVHAFFNQVAQSAACAHLHKVEQRCCRWLLMTRDRMPSGDFLLTHEFLGMMLGVRRTTVTDVMGALQKAGLIRYRRGHVTMLDQQALRERACECYEISKQEFDRLLGDTTAASGSDKKHRLVSEVG
jgi:CRP-like cAMP-binding protein